MIYSKQEFAHLCGMKSSTLAVYRARKKVVYNPDGTIDSFKEPNKSFLQKWSERRKLQFVANTTESEETDSGLLAEDYFISEMEKLSDEIPAERMARLRHETHFLILDLFSSFNRWTSGKMDPAWLIEKSEAWVQTTLKQFDDIALGVNKNHVKIEQVKKDLKL